MKKLILSLMLLHLFALTHAQTNPTLAVGLETLTMNKGTIDVEVLTKIIMEKQKELKGEALKRFMFKMFPQSNYTTKFYIQNCLNVLLNEKNPKVIEKEVLELTTNYALALGVAYAFVKIDGEEIRNANSAYLEYTANTENPDLVKADDYITLIHKVRGDRFLWTFFQRNLLRKEMRKFRIQDKLDLILKNGSQPKNMFSLANNRREIKAKSRRIKNKETIIFKIKQNREVTAEDSIYNMLKDASKVVYDNAKGLDNPRRIKRHFRKLRFDKLRDDLNKNTEFQVYINKLVAQNYKIDSLINTLIDNSKKKNQKKVNSNEKSNIELLKIKDSLANIIKINYDSLKKTHVDIADVDKLISKANDLSDKEKNINALVTYSEIIKIEALNSVSDDIEKQKMFNGAKKINNILTNVKTDTLSFVTLYNKDNLTLYKKLTAHKKKINTLFEAKKNEVNKSKDAIAIKVKEEQLKTLASNQKLVNDELEELLPFEIPFGHVLDVVSLSLSDMNSLQKKGFFKNKIDYRTDDFYLSLGELKAGRIYRDSLNNLKNSICKKINPYIEHYDVIKELIQIAAVKDKSKIIDGLQEQAAILINNTSYISGNHDSKALEKVLNEIPSFKSINNDDKSRLLKSINEKFLLNIGSPLDAKSTKLKSLINEIIEYSKFLESYNANKQLINNLSEISANNDVAKLFKQVQLLNSISHNYTKEFLDVYSVKFDSDFKNYEDAIKLSDYLDIKSIDASRDTLNSPIANEINKHVEQYSQTGNLNNLVEIEKLYQILKDNNLPNPIRISTTEINKKISNTKASFEKINDTVANDLENKIKSNYKEIAGDNGFYKDFLNTTFKNLIIENNLDSKGLDTIVLNKSSKLFSDLYSNLDNIIKSEKITLADINFLEKDIAKLLVELKVRDSSEENDKIYKDLMNNTFLLVPLLKIKALQGFELGIYNEELMTLFEFIANLDKLDKAETFTSIVDMLRTGSKKVEDNLKDGKFKNEYTIFTNAVKKYTLINTNENYVEVDVASFLSDLQTHFNRNDTSVLSLYLSIGLNENVFLKKNFVMPGVSGDTINNIGFASEKLGVKVRLHSFKKYGGYQNVIKDDVYLNKKAPFINDLYAVVYGSGLLYSLANTATDTNFDFAHVGAGVGLRFYNALDVNFTIGFPFVKNSNFGDNAFLGLGLDIPLGEYLEKLGK